MKPIQASRKVKHIFVLLGLLLLNTKIFAASHINMSIANCTSTSPNTMAFDLYIVNDGTDSLKLNSVIYAININAAILANASDVLTWAWDGVNSQLPAAQTGSFALTYVVALKQLKLTSLPSAITSATALTLPLNVPKLIGHFIVTNTSNNWAPFSTTNFAFSTTSGGGSLNTGAVVYVNGATGQTTLNSAANRTFSINCSITLNACALSATASGSSLNCFGQTTGTATATPVSGTGPFTYLWSNGQTTQTATGLAAGTYTVTVTDATPCTASATASVTQPTQLTASGAEGTIACFGGTTTVVITASGGTPPYTNDGSHTVSAGPYSFTVSDANGCTASVSGTITQPTQLTASKVEGTIACFGGTTTVVITASGGTPPYTNDGSHTVSAGPYSFTVSDANGCTTVVSGTISQPAQLTASKVEGTIACFGGTTTVVITASGGTPPYTNDGSHTVSAGPYSFTVTDANGCTTVVSGTITQPTQLTASKVEGTIACFGGSTTVVITANGGTPPYTNDGSHTVSAGPYSFTVSDANGCTTVVSGTISQPTQLTATKEEGTIACFGGTTTVVITAFGGTPPYTNDGSHTVSAGPYSFTVTDANGCTTVVSGTITQPTQLTASPSAGTIACFGGTTTVVITASGGTPPYTNDGSHTVSAGPYSFTVTDANGCTAVVSGTITQPTQLTASPSAGTIACFGGTTSVVITASGGTPPYTNDGSHTVSAGPYSFTVSDANGCTTVVSGTITQPTQLTASPAAGTIACFGGTTTVVITASGGTPPYTNDGSHTVSAGPYSFTVTDANGCTAVVSGTITQPTQVTVSPVATNAGCSGSSGTVTSNPAGGTPPYSYSWSNGATTQNLTNRPAGTYTVTVTDNNGCSATGSATVGPNVPIVVSGTVTNILCKGINNGAISTSVSGGNPGYTYVWNGGNTNQNRSSLAAGTYTVTVTDIAGCTKTGTFVVTQPATIVNINTSQTNVRCYGALTGIASVSVSGGTPPYSYLWNTIPAKTTASISGLAAGSYTCTVTDNIGCVKNVIVNLTQPTQIVAVQTQTNVTFPSGNDGTASVAVSGGVGPYSYLWNTSPTQTTASITGLVAGVYKCTITDSKGCPLKVTFIITEPFSRPAGPAAGSDWNVRIAPNPSNGIVMLNFESDKDQNAVVRLEDMTGKSVYRKDIQQVTGSNEILFDFQYLPKGVYMMRIETADRSKVLRLIIQ